MQIPFATDLAKFYYENGHFAAEPLLEEKIEVQRIVMTTNKPDLIQTLIMLKSCFQVNQI
jgi:hypothetical protein